MFDPWVGLKCGWFSDLAVWNVIVQGPILAEWQMFFFGPLTTNYPLLSHPICTPVFLHQFALQLLQPLMVCAPEFDFPGFEPLAPGQMSGTLPEYDEVPPAEKSD